MLRLIDANDKYLEQYKEAYLESLKQIELGNIKKHSMMFLNPEDNDIIRSINDTIILCSILSLFCC